MRLRGTPGLRLAVVALGMAAAPVAWASGGEHEAFDANKFVWQLVNLSVLAWIIVKFGGSAINKALRARHDQMKTDLETANRRRAEAEAALAHQEQRFRNLAQEVAAIRAGAKKDAEDEKARLVAAAEERARRIKEETAFLLEQQVKEAEVRLRREVAQTALEVASDLLKRSVGAADHDRLLQRFVADTEASPAPTGRPS